MKFLNLFISLLLTTNVFAECDHTLAKKIYALLDNAIQESNATNGCIAIMEATTGKLVMKIGDVDERQPTKLFTPIALLACMESGQIKLTDMIDTGDGIYISGADTIKDHNWRRGGYGEVSVLGGFVRYSNIATLKMIKKVFKQPTDYQQQLERMGINDIENIDNIYYNASPLQILTLYNMIANNTMKALPSHIEAVRQALRSNVVDGLGKLAASTKVEIAGYGRMVHLTDGTYKADFCGYFPADNPEYTIIVSLKKEDGQEAKRESMSLFRRLAELLDGLK